MKSLEMFVRRWVALQLLGALALTGCSASDEGMDEATSATQDGIIGGSNAAVGGHPWIVEIWNNTYPPPPLQDYQDPYALHGGCGAALISANWVVTAAHCVGDVDSNGVYHVADPGNLYLILGDYDRKGFGTPVEQGNYEQGRFASEVHPHPNYTSDAPGHHDIALVKLQTPAILNARVKAIALGSQAVSSGATVIAAGWGATAVLNPFQPGTEESLILQRASLTVRSTSVCNASVAYRPLDSDELCAGGNNSNPTTCHGDSGGPLIRAVGSSYELVGITDWGNNYCASYGVFARISSHYNWIRSYVP